MTMNAYLIEVVIVEWYSSNFFGKYLIDFKRSVVESFSSLRGWLEAQRKWFGV